MSNRGPFVRVGDASPDLLSRLTFRRDVLALHGKGPRVLAEFLAEVHGMLAVEQRSRLLARLAVYRDLPDDLIEGAGGNAFPAIPLHAVKRDDA